MTALTDARLAIGGLSKPSKMPGMAYSIPATACVTGSKLRDIPDSACSNCYALKGRYMFPNVQNALQRRLSAMASPTWSQDMVTAINGADWFRWFDSGDLQSIGMLANIVKVCRQTPGTRHWLPTREKSIVSQYLRIHGAFPKNLTVRVSAAMIDGKPPKSPNTSTIHNNRKPRGYHCPAPSQGNKCVDCRACWDRNVKNVSYGLH
jgi:hypothetical protein